MSGRRAFTLVELLVVIAIIVVLMGMVAPGLSRIWYLANVDVCYSNIHQLSVAWLAYQADNDGYIVQGSTRRNAYDWAKWGNETPSNPNRYSLITSGKLYPYAGDVKIYLCPTDTMAHIRSYSTTSIMNGHDWGALPYVHRYSNIRDPRHEIVFVEEKDCRSSSNMGTFAQDPKSWNKNQWVDYVANFHEGWDNVGFADGHAEHWQWTDPRTLQNSEDEAFFRPDNGNPDLQRLRESMFNKMPGAY